MPIDPVPTASSELNQSAIWRPRFGLQHVAVLSTIMAVMLAAGSQREIRGLELSPLALVAFRISAILFTLIGSMAVTIVVYGLWWRRQGRAFFNEPGHWLLVVIATQQMLTLINLLLLNSIAVLQGIDIVDATKLIPLRLNMLLPSLVLAIVNFYIGRRKSPEIRWRRVFYVNALAEIIPVIGQMLVLIFLERAVRAERVRRPLSARWKNTRGVEPMGSGQVVTPPRGFAHWCGVAFTFVYAGMMVLIAMGIVFYIVGALLLR